MADSQDITLYTSIPPKVHRLAGGVEYGETYQKECINSWIAGGFRVVSINCRAEIASLESKYPQVRFADSGSEDFRTCIHTFLQTIAATGERIAGIINADCYLAGVGAFLDTLYSHAPESMILVRRLNVDATLLRPVGRNGPGFDGFFFDTELLTRIEGSEDWRIGEPWWDFWFPAAMHFAGARLRMLDVPILLHLEHEQRWDEEEADIKAETLWNALKKQRTKPTDGRQTSQSVGLGGADLSDEEHKSKQIWTHLVPWLHRQTERVRLADESLAGNFFSRVLIGMEGSQEATLRHQLETVTLPRWLRSKRGAVRRLRNRILR